MACITQHPTCDTEIRPSQFFQFVRCTPPQEGSGWCPFADIYLAVHVLRTVSNGAVTRVLVIDLDVHQGNGVGRCKLVNNDKNLLIADAYNGQIFPKDATARRAIGIGCLLSCSGSSQSDIRAVPQTLSLCLAPGAPPTIT